VSESDHPAPAPPSGEEIHLPGPTILPFACAISITLIVIGTTINLIISAIGLVAFVIIVIRWVNDTRRDVAELPEEHVH
jgi:Flp pilus assembly protein TadB